MYATLDPVRLLQDIRASQQKLVNVADTPTTTESGSMAAPTTDQFLANFKTIWRNGQANPTARVKPKAPRSRRRPDPLAAVKQQLEICFAAEAWRTARELLDKLQAGKSRPLPGWAPWMTVRGQFMPPLEVAALPANLLERFRGPDLPTEPAAALRVVPREHHVEIGLRNGRSLRVTTLQPTCRTLFFIA
jgi:hypothetical protein